MINYDDTKKCEELKMILNRIYGRAMMATVQPYTDIDSLLDIDCDFCRNANTCGELSHNNDLSYMSCGSAEKGIRVFFQTGDTRPTQLIVEELRVSGLNFNKLEWKLIAKLVPNYCPFCGRPLFENMIQRRDKQ